MKDYPITQTIPFKGPTNKVAIVGAGFFGCAVALELSKYFEQVVLIDAEAQPMMRASYRNQARIHMGYHYPRNLMTGLSCARNYREFVKTFPKCVVDHMPAYYGVAKENSKITSKDFETFCARVGAPLSGCDAKTLDAIVPKGLDQLFEVEEACFDAAVLRSLMSADLKKHKIKLLMGNRVTGIAKAKDKYVLDLKNAQGHDVIDADHVYLCTYGDINRLLVKAGLRPVELRQQLAEMAVLDVTGVLPDYALTVVDGPFFSLFPFPDLAAKTLSHVAYTPHLTWIDNGQSELPDSRKILGNLPRSNARKMMQDAANFIPDIEQATYLESLWEIKTTLPAECNSDGRPILIRQCDRGIFAVLGGKMDNIFDIQIILRSWYKEPAYA